MSTVQRVMVARGETKASKVLKNCQIVNVFNGKIEKADIAIDEGISLVLVIMKVLKKSISRDSLYALVLLMDTCILSHPC